MKWIGGCLHIDQQYRDKVLKSKGNQRFLLNLKELNKEILLHSGILDNIDMTNYCTYRDKIYFFHTDVTRERQAECLVS